MSGTVYPSDAPRPTLSRAEGEVWKALRNQLPGGWIAWHSLRIRDRNNYLGEGDFVLAHRERGLLVLEVKGGLVECRGGHWFSNGEALGRAPLSQALSCRSWSGASMTGIAPRQPGAPRWCFRRPTSTGSLRTTTCGVRCWAAHSSPGSPSRYLLWSTEHCRDRGRHVATG